MTKDISTIDPLVPGGNLEAYIRAVHRIPILAVEQEGELARRLYAGEDLDAARRLVMAHLRFVVYVARSYSGYGLAEADLIQEGNVGLMKAVRRFNPEFGVRLVSFAVHWIKAEMHEFILRNWRIVKIATTKPQRKLFFNLRRARKRLGWLHDTEVTDIARMLDVEPAEVRRMEMRLSAHDEAFDPGFDDDYSPSQYLVSVGADPAEIVEANDLVAEHRRRLMAAFSELDPRAREIIQCRWLIDKKVTLHQLADRFKISAERVRQIEQQSLKRLKQSFS